MKRNNILSRINIKLLFISLIFSLMAVLTCFLYYIGSQEKNVEISVDSGKVYITNFKINRTNYLLNKFAREYKLDYEDNKILLKSGDKFKIKASRITNLFIDFENIKNETAILKIKNGSEILKKEISSKTKEKCVKTNEQLRVELITYFKENILGNIMVSILLLIFFAILFYKMFNYYMRLIRRLDNNKTFNLKEMCNIFIIILLTLWLSLYALVSVLNIFMIVVYCIFIIFIGFKTFKKLSVNLSNLFFVLASIFGITMILILPPFHVPDEGAHYFKAYSLYSNKDVFVHKSKKYIGLSDSVAYPINMYNMDLLGYSYKTSTKDYFTDKMFFSKDSDEKYAFYFDNTAYLSPLCYIPSAMAIALTETLGLPFMISFRFAKLLNLLIFVFIGFHSLKILPKFKNIFFMTLLFPITLQQAGGICQDSLTLGLCFLYLAYIIKGIYDKNKFNIIDKVMLLMVPLLLGFCKIGYFPITFLCLLIKKNKFKNKKESIVIKLLSILPCLILSFSQYLAAGAGTIGTSFYPISMIFTDPITIARVCLKTFFNRFHFDLLTGFVDGFGWSTIWNLKLITFVAALAYLIFIITVDNKSKAIDFKHRLWYFICSFVIIGFIYASLLFAWTPVGFSEIEGLQCRYFIIPALLLYISLSNLNISIKLKNREFWMGMSVSLVHIACFFSILVGFY